MSDFSILYESFNKKNIIKEADSDFKGSKLVGKKTKPFFHWEHKLKPATVDIDFGYYLTFDIDKILEDYSISEGKIDYTNFFYDIIKPNLDERAIKTLARQVHVPGFDTAFVTYNSESTVKTLDPTRKTKYYFSHTVTLEAKDSSKDYNRKEMIDICQKFVNNFEKIGFKDTPYYKISNKK